MSDKVEVQKVSEIKDESSPIKSKVDKKFLPEQQGRGQQEVSTSNRFNDRPHIKDRKRGPPDDAEDSSSKVQIAEKLPSVKLKLYDKSYLLRGLELHP